MKGKMRRDVLEASLTAFAMKPHKNFLTIIALHNREPCCLEERRQSFLSHCSV